MKLIKNLLRDEEGQGLVEYTLIFGFITLVCISAIKVVGGSLKYAWDNISDFLNTIFSQ